jgi:uncharacterized membrane protein YidH (DUF202 family)
MAPPPATPPPDLEELAPGRARERTQLAWNRTAIAFAALGGAILKKNIAAGLVVVAMGVLIWGLHRQVNRSAGSARPRQLLFVTVTVTAVAVVALVVAFLDS